MRKETLRMFIAAQLQPAALRELAAFSARMKREFPGNYSRVENFHITLAFLGDTLVSSVPTLEAIISGCCKNTPPVTLTLSGAGFFGNPVNAILWCGMDGAAPLVDLSNRLREGLSAQGVRYDPKPMNPHITLARKVDMNKADIEKYRPAALQSKADRISLYSSQRINGVLTYTPLTTTVLK
ncbi:RNA 2',3'-cyclic phosphodiesterase [Christensenellaceae bacterium OttesenSCG-928-K19]|nr:RNA 2',3'-cyclic phosphodiesterase [Christensenellaceae bacterium OttesenSCG-928-K19]